MESKSFRIVGWLVLLFLVAGGVLWAVGNGGESEPDTQGAVATTTSEWILGNPNATTTLVEWSDPQCPACRTYQPLVNQLMEEFGDRVKFSYKHFPLPQHANAIPAAAALEAAGRQGTFFPMLDLIFERQNEWEKASLIKAENLFLSYAESLGLDTRQFKEDRVKREVREKIKGEYAEGGRIGVNSTPTFYLNGIKLTSNPRSYDEFRALITATVSQ
ncbi:MAG: thioredoxin domain-containing protein [bacterium]|nr:thioredoxin domain-containing protein [bacterium]